MGQVAQTDYVQLVDNETLVAAERRLYGMFNFGTPCHHQSILMGNLYNSGSERVNT